MYKLDLIEEDLYLNGSFEAQNLELLKENDIKYVLSVFNDNLCNKSEAITYMQISVDENPLQDLLSYFPEANKFIATAQEAKKSVLVHCHAGLSRSVTIVVAFIMNKHKMSYESALKLVNSCHSICLNGGFIAQLKLYEKMGFTLNANNRELRQHLMKTCLNFANNQSVNEKRIKTYFERRDYIESNTQDLDLGKRCLCANCGQHLFNEIHIQPTNTAEESESSEECDQTYIEPQKWMKALTEPFYQMSFAIKCPKCEEEVIEFKNQFLKYQCNCCPLKYPDNYIHILLAKKFKIESND